MNLIKWILPLALLAGCSNNDQLIKGSKRNQELLLNRSKVAIADDKGSPIAGALVQIGLETQTTNADGLVSVPSSWTEEQPVTIVKEGYVKTTYLKQTPKGQTFEVRQKTTSVKNEVKGVITGFGALPSDGFIDFGLSMTSLDAQSALNFDISQMISEENDVVNVMGKELSIPTNIFVPKQKENYSFIPVTVEKAFYRLFYSFQGIYNVQTSLGKFDFKKVSDKLKAGKSFFEVVNDFEFLSLGTKTVNVNQANVALDMNGNQMKLAKKVSFAIPLPTSGMFFGVSLFENEGRLYPIDIKLREGAAQMLALPESVTRGTVLLVNADKVQVTKDIAGLSNSMSTALVDSQKMGQGFMLERVAAPQLTNTGMKLSKPNLKGNLKGFATYAALSDVKTERYERFAVDRADVTWEIYSPGWIDTIDLPEVNDVRASQRWQVTFYGIDSVENKQFNGPQTLNQATHAVHNSVTF